MSVLVDGQTGDGHTVDMTRKSIYSSRDASIVTVSEMGHLIGRADGETSIDINAGGHQVEVRVSVRGIGRPRRFHFENDVIPILSKFGCNTSGCHGKAEGQNGFKLSVFGFDVEADWAALTSEGRGRRVFPAAPRESLLLQKISGEVPHGGGIRIRRGSREYRLLSDWISAGMPRGDLDAPRVASLRVMPGERQLAMNSSQQTRVIATYSDGSEADVTQHARYQSNNEGLGTVDEFGLVETSQTPGEVAVMAAYMGAVDVFRVLIPGEALNEDFPELPANNFIDTLVAAKLRKLNLVPSELCSDSEYLRRVYLDLIGTLPTADEGRRFLSDERPDRRERLVDELLVRPEFADLWALRWSDLLRVDRQALEHKGAYAYYRWIRDSFVANKPYDQFVRELITADGVLSDSPAGYFYKVVGDPGQRASTLSQVLLGVRIECAKCHHHPSDRWSQTDYYGMQALLTQASFKPTKRGEMLGAFSDSPTKHPRTGVEIFAHPLGEARPANSPADDRRAILADWITAPDNRWMARNFVNRIWAQLLGRGIIEPVDDFRATNPPTNPELLDALAAHFVEQKYNFHTLLKTIIASQTYQRSSRPNATNERDEQNYSRALLKKLDAEVLFDAVCQVTGVPEKFPGVPAGSRAVQLWDSQMNHYFLRQFGRPIRLSACQCERTSEPSVSQVLHVFNSPKLNAKLTHDGGRIAGIVDNHSVDGDVVDELYLTFYSRRPSAEEREAGIAYFQSHNSSRRRAAEDIAWSMMNSLEFLFNH